MSPLSLTNSSLRRRQEGSFSSWNQDLVQVTAELDYFQQEFGSSFERTYGWAWLLKLQEELEASAEVLKQSS